MGLATVIMINRNGGAFLQSALRSLRSDLEETWKSAPIFELLVVDNGSTDMSVQNITKGLAGACFPWRLVHEPEPGVNAARNAGIREARGSLLIYTDSDLEFQPGWLSAYLSAATSYPEIEVFGGRVRVGAVEGEVPSWLDLVGPYRRPSIVVQMDCGDEETVLPLSVDQGPVGPNMAFRRSVLDREGWFDTHFGLRPGSLVPGAEAEYFNRLMHSELAFLYVPDATVYHPLKQSQISKSYFLSRMFGIGRVHARIRRIRGLPCKQLYGVTLYVLTDLIKEIIRYCKSWLTRDPRRGFYYRCQVAIMLGQLYEDWFHAKNNQLVQAVAAAKSYAVGASRGDDRPEVHVGSGGSQ